jgi:hypothetical protein
MQNMNADRRKPKISHKKEPAIRTVRQEILPFFTRLLEEDDVKYELVADGKVKTMLTSSSFHDYVERAMCIEQQGYSKIPVYSRQMLERDKPVGAYHILRKDLEQYLKDN